MSLKLISVFVYGGVSGAAVRLFLRFSSLFLDIAFLVIEDFGVDDVVAGFAEGFSRFFLLKPYMVSPLSRKRLPDG